jgi:hypothetical protein
VISFGHDIQSPSNYYLVSPATRLQPALVASFSKWIATKVKQCEKEDSFRRKLAKR